MVKQEQKNTHTGKSRALHELKITHNANQAAHSREPLRRHRIWESYNALLHPAVQCEK